MPKGWIDWNQSEMSQGQKRRQEEQSMLEEAFWRDIQEAPGDDAPRLIYADWLDEQGDPERAARAEFIRVQCELARLPADADDRRAEQEKRQDALWKKHRKTWCAPLKPFSNKFEFRRGFPDQVLVHGKTFLAHAEAVLAAAPVFSVRLRDSKLQIEEIAQHPALRRLVSLSLYWNHIGMKRAQAFFTSPHLERLSDLDVNDNEIRLGGLRALLEARLPRVRSLNLRSNELGDEGLGLLAAAPLLGQLRVLNFSHNDVGEAGVAALASSPHSTSIASLDLGYNQGVGDGAARALASSPSLRRLEHLLLKRDYNMRSAGITAAGAKALAASSGLAHLTSLNLGRHTRLLDEGSRALCGSPHLARLTSLDLHDCGLTPACLAPLADATFLPALVSLNLSENRLDDAAGLRTLFGSERLSGLRSLKLDDCAIGDAGLEALAACPSLAGLRSLSICRGVSVKGAEALASSPCLARLTELDLHHCDIGDEGALALARSPHLTRLRRLRVSAPRYQYRQHNYPREQGRKALLERFGKDVCDFG
jgi:uncharacterized protein (TIGR02996 family)